MLSSCFGFSKYHSIRLTVVILGMMVALLTVLNVIMTIRNISRLEQVSLALERFGRLHKLVLLNDILMNSTGGDRPPVKEVPVALEPKEVIWEDLSGTFSLHNDTAWGTVFPTSGSVLDPATNQTYLVSMIHQLHCLDLIRVAYVTKKTDFPGHVGHCMRYLLQAVLCNADSTLEAEGLEFVDEKWQFVVHQWGIGHRCRDRIALNQYLVEHEVDPQRNVSK